MEQPNISQNDAIGINRYILDCILEEKHLWRFFDTENMKELLRSFLVQEKPIDCVSIAQNISERALSKHKKRGGLHPFLSRLAQIEEGVQYFYEDLRDHINHSVYVYLLGLCFIEKIPAFRRIDTLSWKIAALLHDIGYPVEWFSYSTKSYFNLVSKQINPNFYDSPPIIYNLSIHNLERLVFSMEDAFDRLNMCLGLWKINVNLREIFISHLNRGKVDHGILSSLTILKIVDYLYLKNNPARAKRAVDEDNINWGKHCFDTQIIDAVAAISIHNILDEVKEIWLRNSPIAYLLVLCDNLQQWNRFSPKRKMHSPDKVILAIDENSIKCTLNIDNEHFLEVENVVEEKLKDQILKPVINRENIR